MRCQCLVRRRKKSFGATYASRDNAQVDTKLEQTPKPASTTRSYHDSGAEDEADDQDQILKEQDIVDATLTIYLMATGETGETGAQVVAGISMFGQVNQVVWLKLLRKLLRHVSSCYCETQILARPWRLSTGV